MCCFSVKQSINTHARTTIPLLREMLNARLWGLLGAAKSNVTAKMCQNQISCRYYCFY